MTPSLLTIDDIAAMWGVTRRHARDVLVRQPGFPPLAPATITPFAQRLCLIRYALAITQPCNAGRNLRLKN